MRVVLIGATGGMGSFVLDEFASRGIDLVAVSHRPDALAPAPHVQVVTADAYDLDGLRDVLPGADAVVSSFNPGWLSDGLYEKYLKGARTIQAATKAAGVQRLLVIGGASSLLGADGKELIESGLPPEPYGSGVRAARDYLQEIRQERDLDWVYLSPPAECGPVGPDGRRGTYRVGANHPVLDAQGRNSLSRQDLAVAVADEILHPVHHRTRFTVGY